MGKFTNALDNKEAIIRLQWVFVAILTIALCLAIHGLKTAPSDLTLHIPPDLRSGAKLKPGEVPPPSVYAFAHYIWQQVNHWSRDGDKDYGGAIFRMQAYLTPACREWLERDLQTKANNGELSLRTRGLQEIPGHEYEEFRVRPLSNSAWRVELDYAIKETVRGMAVKEVGVRYPLRVVRFDADRELNQFGLAVDCLNDEEQASRI
ncbi:MAG TPA: TIGR03746 family integrating conjugative element protein, partial [Ramlibacter sp.]|nr:TIGR03746 family integrating conjugative element protein [Ramlibacter sp.]